MWMWLSLLLTPLLALANLSTAYTLSTYACAQNTHGWLHLANALFLLASVMCTALAARERRHRQPPAFQANQGPIVDTRRRFVAWLSVPSGAFFSLVILAQWLSVWLLPVCA